MRNDYSALFAMLYICLLSNECTTVLSMR